MKINPLETLRLYLEMPDIKFAMDVFEYSCDKIFCRFIRRKPPKRVEESTIFLKELIRDNELNNRAYWVIVHKETLKAIGTLGFIISGPINNVVDFGYGISRAYWGKGIFQEAASEILKFSFNKLNVKRIQVYTREDNIASIKAVYIKILLSTYRIVKKN